MHSFFVPIVESRFRTKLPPALIVMQSCKQDNLRFNLKQPSSRSSRTQNATQQSVYVNVPGKQSNGIGTTGWYSPFLESFLGGYLFLGGLSGSSVRFFSFIGLFKKSARLRHCRFHYLILYG